MLGENLSESDTEIVVVDDCSTKDDPERMTREVGGSRVRFVRQEHNVGAIRNFNTCIRLAQGELIHILHGDDFVLPGFYASVLGHATKYPQVGFLCTRTFLVDEAGEIENMNRRLAFMEVPMTDPWPLIKFGNLVYTPSVVLRKAVYERAGGFNQSLVHLADWEMWVRAVATSGGVCINKPLAAYRVFAGQDTARLQQTGENVRDALRLCDIWVKHLQGFEPVPFLRMMEQSATWQVSNFSARGMPEAVAANGRVLDELRSRIRRLLAPPES